MFCTKHKTLFCGDLSNQFRSPLYIVQALLLYLLRIVGRRVIADIDAAASVVIVRLKSGDMFLRILNQLLFSFWQFFSHKITFLCQTKFFLYSPLCLIAIFTALKYNHFTKISKDSLKMFYIRRFNFVFIENMTCFFRFLLAISVVF